MRDDGLYELTSITNGASIGYQIEDQIGQTAGVYITSLYCWGTNKKLLRGP